jgi:hypothetical protein
MDGHQSLSCLRRPRNDEGMAEARRESKDSGTVTRQTAETVFDWGRRRLKSCQDVAKDLKPEYQPNPKAQFNDSDMRLSGPNSVWRLIAISLQPRCVELAWGFLLFVVLAVSLFVDLAPTILIAGVVQPAVCSHRRSRHRSGFEDFSCRRWIEV